MLQDPKSGYYDTLCQRLDVALTLSEHSASLPPPLVIL